MKKTPTCAILPDYLEKKLQAECEINGRTKTDVIKDALDVYFRKGRSVKGILYLVGEGNDEKT